jgi:hypothetical protein
MVLLKGGYLGNILLKVVKGKDLNRRKGTYKVIGKSKVVSLV